MLNAEAREHDKGIIQTITAIGQADNGTGIMTQNQLERIAAEHFGKPIPTHPDGYASCLLRRRYEAMTRGVIAVLSAAAQVYGLQALVLVHP